MCFFLIYLSRIWYLVQPVHNHTRNINIIRYNSHEDITLDLLPISEGERAEIGENQDEFTA